MPYTLYLLPLALFPDLDHFLHLHRAGFHTMFIPLIFLGAYMMYRNPKKRYLMITGAVYTISHVVLDLFDGGAGLFYPVTSHIYFITAELSYHQGFFWILDWGAVPYSDRWIEANGYIFNSAGAGSLVFLLLAGICIYYRSRRTEVSQ